MCRHPYQARPLLLRQSSLLRQGPPNRPATSGLRNGSNDLGTAPLSSGTASLLVTNFSAGQHLISASWPGDSNRSPAVSQAGLLSVGKAQTTTTLSASATSFDVAVAPVPPGGGTPTGTVLLTDTATQVVLASGSWNGGSATFPVCSAASIAATYSGDTNFLNSLSESHRTGPHQRRLLRN
jgi:hypothetical protein